MITVVWTFLPIASWNWNMAHIRSPCEIDNNLQPVVFDRFDTNENIFETRNVQSVISQTWSVFVGTHFVLITGIKLVRPPKLCRIWTCRFCLTSHWYVPGLNTNSKVLFSRSENSSYPGRLPRLATDGNRSPPTSNGLNARLVCSLAVRSFW